MFSFKYSVLPAVAALVSTVAAAEWGTNYEEALRRAGERGCVVMADFTGSDWCGFCISLHSQVLHRPEFLSWASRHVELLEVDVPHRADFPAELMAQNRALCEKYRVTGFPTVLVLDAQGRPLGGLFGFEGDMAEVQRILGMGVRAGELLRQAESVQGEAKLLAMVEAWKLIPEELKELNPALRDEIAALDTQDISGLRAAAEAERRLQECKAAADAAPTDAAALVIVDAALAQAVPQNRRQLLELKYRLLIHGVETPEEVYAAAEVAYAMIDADLRITAEEKESRKRQLRGVFANPWTSIRRSRIIYRTRPKR